MDKTEKRKRSRTEKYNKPNGGPIRALWRFDSDGTLIVENPTTRDYIHYYKNCGKSQGSM